MPVPSVTEIAALAGFKGMPRRHEVRFKEVLAGIIFAELVLFSENNQILPGVAAVASPPTYAGITIGPGLITGVVRDRTLIGADVGRATRRLGLDPVANQGLDRMLTEALNEGMQVLRTATMRPGVTINGGVTVVYGHLTAPMVAALRGQLPHRLARFEVSGGIKGKPGTSSFSPSVAQGRPMGLPNDLAASIGKLVGDATFLFLESVRVGPGIPVQGTTTTGYGMLL